MQSANGVQICPWRHANGCACCFKMEQVPLQQELGMAMLTLQAKIYPVKCTPHLPLP